MVSDEVLIERIRGGDLTAYEQMVRRYQGLVFGVAYHSLGNVDDARDISQNVFIRAFVRLDQVRDTSRLGSWLRQIAVNECRAWTSRKREEPFPTEVRAKDTFVHAENRLLLDEALQALDETSRLTVILFYLHAYSLKEIGSFLDEPVTTIKSRLRNARAKLRREMEKTLEKKLEIESLPEDFATRVTHMIEAAQKGDAATIKALLEKDPSLASAEEVPGKGHTALHIAASSGDASVVELLLAYGADPNARDESDNASPMHYAAERGWLECVKLLVEAGGDVNATDDLHERGPLGWSVFFEPIQWETAEYLMGQGARLDLFSATALNRPDAIRSVVEHNPSALRSRTSEFDGKLSPIEYAASKGRHEIAHLLAELGSEIGLSEAAGLGRSDELRDLLSHRPTQEQLDQAVWISVQAGQIETTRLLLEGGANPDYAPNGTSLIFKAIASINRPMADLLLKLGANLEFRDSYWKSTALGWEVFYGRADGLLLALELGAQVDPQLIETARAGERGEWRRYTSATSEDYRRVAEILTSV